MHNRTIACTARDFSVEVAGICFLSEWVFQAKGFEDGAADGEMEMVSWRFPCQNWRFTPELQQWQSRGQRRLTGDTLHTGDK